MAADEAPTSPRGRRALWLAVTVLVAALDLWSKGLWSYPADIYGPPRHQKTLVEGWLTIQIQTVYNTGAIWSIGRGKTNLLLWVTALAIPLLAAWMFWPVRASGWDTCAKAMVLGGALGNLHDRYWYRAVRDFLDFHFGDYVYPTFNVADIALVAGIVMLLLSGLKEGRAQKRSAAA